MQMRISQDSERKGREREEIQEKPTEKVLYYGGLNPLIFICLSMLAIEPS